MMSHFHFLHFQVPKSNKTALKDEVEAFLYNKLFPTMQEFADLKTRSDKDSIQMPIPIGECRIYFSFAVFSNSRYMLKVGKSGLRPLYILW